METAASIIDFKRYINERTTHFTGRQWVFQRIDAWLADPVRPRFFLLVANPGSGKTALFAQLCQFSDGTVVPPDDLLYLTPHFISASHFCSAQYSLWIDPLTFTRSLALQLSRHQDYARALLQVAEHDVNIHVQQLIHNVETGGVVQGVVIQNLTIANLNPQESFNRIILKPLETMYHQGFSTPMTIVIDGLDEALAHAGQPTIVDLLSRLHELPQQVRFLLTSRPDERVENKFGDAEEVLLSAAEYDQHSQEDIQQYVQVRLRNYQELATRAAQMDSNHVVELSELVPRKAEGNFLYVRFLLDAMTKGVRSLTEAGRIARRAG